MGLVGISLVGTLFAATGTSTADQAREMAEKDYKSAISKISAEQEADLLECATHKGGAARACEMQARAKRELAEDEAKQQLEFASERSLLQDDERKNAEKRRLENARLSYGMAKALIKKENRNALAQCGDLKGDEKKICRADVMSRTNEAKRSTEISYKRIRTKAKSIAEK